MFQGDVPESILQFVKSFNDKPAQLTKGSAMKRSHEGQDAQIWTSRTLHRHTHTGTHAEREIIVSGLMRVNFPNMNFNI